MRIGRYRFAPPVWSVLVLLAVAGLMAGLGVWQIQRGEYKQAMLAQRQAAIKSAPEPFVTQAAKNEDGVPPYGRRYTVAGRMDATRQILLDNQVHNERIGYRVWTPVLLKDGRRVLVDRGWVSLGPGGRSTPPDPEGPRGDVSVTGIWRDLPRPGMRLGDPSCADAPWPRVLNYPTVATLRCQYDAPVVDGVLLLDGDDPRGFVRDWNAELVRMPPIRHFGYALQWFAMTAAVVVIFLVLNLRRNR